VDTFTRKKRSEIMGRIRGKDTKPEMAVRRLLHQLGFHFRLHRKDLPGTPDIALPRHKIAVLVHGCFWHRHTCRDGKHPKSNSRYWESKIADNQCRDRRQKLALRRLGWKVITVWECEIRKPETLQKRLSKALPPEITTHRKGVAVHMFCRSRLP